jgi:pimeloyl-ACP methyl ester carboxylesterase
VTPLMAAMVSGHVDVGGASLYYETIGAGSPVVLLHGLDLDHRMWDDQVAPLAHMHTVVRYDLRRGEAGEAGSDTVSDPGVGYGIRPRGNDHAEDLKALLDHLELAHVSLVGLSLGGGAALDFAVAYPQAVRALVLVNPVLEQPAAARLGDVLAPTLVAVGELDTPEAHEMAATLEAGIPDAWKVVIPGAGRMVNRDDPKRFNEVVMAFLAETERKSRR